MTQVEFIEFQNSDRVVKLFADAFKDGVIYSSYVATTIALCSEKLVSILDFEEYYCARVLHHDRLCKITQFIKDVAKNDFDLSKLPFNELDSLRSFFDFTNTPFDVYLLDNLYELGKNTHIFEMPKYFALHQRYSIPISDISEIDLYNILAKNIEAGRILLDSKYQKAFLSKLKTAYKNAKIVHELTEK